MNRSDMTKLGSFNGSTVYRASAHCYFVEVKNADGSRDYVAIYNCMPYENPSMCVMLIPMPYGEMR